MTSVMAQYQKLHARTSSLASMPSKPHNVDCPSELLRFGADSAVLLVTAVPVVVAALHVIYTLLETVRSKTK